MEAYRIKKANLFWIIIDKMAYRMKDFAKLYEKTVGNEYRKEREKFDLSKAKKILHIGCGSYPLTAIILAEMDNVNIVTIDNSPRAVKLANKVISKKKLNGKIKAEQGDGTIFPLDEFDTIIISGCSVPKIKVLEHAFKDSKPKSRIIIRDAILDMESIINNSNPHQNIKIVEKMENHIFPDSTYNSFYLLKNN
jgi:cyclopropane fatty-acyl-phospholipid synthase-like methyltransferase